MKRQGIVGAARTGVLLLALGGMVSGGESLFAQAAKPAESARAYTPAQLFSIKPVQAEVDVDTPGSPEEMEKFTVQQAGRSIVVKDETGRLYRAFTARGDGPVNQWSFYKNGIEVYRQFTDEKGASAPNEFRWMNNSGTRWGIAKPGGKEIDSWKMISAEEVSAEIIAAIAKKDLKRFMRVVPTAEELAALELSDEMKTQLAQKIRQMPQGFEKAVAELALSPNAKWIQYSGGRPGFYSTGETNQNGIVVYENAVAVAEDEAIKPIVLGTIFQIGENNWRFLGTPHLDDPERQLAGEFTFFPSSEMASVISGQSQGAAPSEDMMKLITKLQELQGQLHEAAMKDRAAIHEEILTTTLDIAMISTTVEDIDLWIRQAANSVDGGVRANEFPEGPKKLDILFTKVNEQLKMPNTASYVKYIQIMSEYYQSLNEKANINRVNLVLVENLENLVTEFEKTDGAARAMLELAGYFEMMSDQEDALKWYRKAVTDFPDTTLGARAAGAVRRLTSVGKAVPFTATASNGAKFNIAQAKGKITVLYFWYSWSETESQALKALADANKNVRILAINVDDSVENMNAYIENNPIMKKEIPCLREEGGLESPPALYWGLQQPPMMILYDAEGKVAAQNIVSTETLAAEIEKLK